MWSTLTLILVGTMPIAAIDEDAKKTFEDPSIPSNSLALPSTTTEVVLPWADTDTPDCENNTCVRKCCGKGKVISYRRPNFGCTDPLPDEPKFEVAIKHIDGRPAESEKQLLLLKGFPTEVSNCSAAALPNHRTGHLLANGSFYTAYENQYRGHLEYCIEVHRTGSEGTKLTAFTCYTELVETARSLFRYYAHSICLVASCIALTVVALCHIFIPKLRDLQGKCLLSHVSSLLIGNMALLSATLWHSFSNWQCVAIGIVLHTAFIATYMWLTVMCFDIWRFVRMSVQGIPVQHAIGGENRLFLYYCGVAWGLTAAIATVTCTLQFLPEDALPDYVIKPHFGVNRCFIIEDDANLFVYFFVILGVLCMVNVFLVGKTAHYLYGGGLTLCRCCRPQQAKDTDSAVFNAKYLDIFWQRFQIFMLTIVVWATEVLSFKIPPKEMWELTDLLNTLQGVVILLIFMRQQKKRAMVLEKLRKMTNRAQQAVQKITIYDETSFTIVSSDKETIEKIRKLSKQEETVASTIMKSVAQNKIDLISMQTVEDVPKESSKKRGEKGVHFTGFEGHTNMILTDVDLREDGDLPIQSNKD